MPINEQDMMSNLVSLADMTRVQLNHPDGLNKARQIVAERIGTDRFVILSLLELSDIQFKAKADDRPTVGDVNSHIDRWIGDDGVEIGTISGEGWKIASLGK